MMWEMSQMDSIIAACRTLSKIPTVSSGKLSKIGNRVSAKWAIRNLEKGHDCKYITTYLLDENLRVMAESEFAFDVSSEILQAVSPFETQRALIREEIVNNVKKHYLEVWQNNTLEHCVDLTALDIHGEVYADSDFASLEWSLDETRLVYIAEKKLPKSEPYIKRKFDDMPNVGIGEPAPTKGEEYLYREDWGEQLVGKHQSVIVVCHVATETFSVLEGLPESWCPGQVRFAWNGLSVVGVAWKSEPRRLGLVYCTNRPSYVFALNLERSLTKYSGEGLAVRSPRVGAYGVVWLQRPADGPHHGCHQLVMLPNNQTEVKVLVDMVETEVSTANGDSFYGIYNVALPNRCFSMDGKRIVFSTPQKFEHRCYVVNIDNGSLMDISNKCYPGSTSALDVERDVILATCSNVTMPPKLYVAHLPPAGLETTIQWRPISKAYALPPAVNLAAFEYLDLEHPESEHAVKSFSAIYSAPKARHNEKLPLIVWPHGGPHTCFTNSFSFELAMFNSLGFACIQVNYRGSSGAGQASLQMLPKHIGDADVKDCKLATEYAVGKYPVDGKKLCLYGGSHGGFLVTHLSGQYPDYYAAVVARNPVTDVATMINTTDIADWCAVEAGFNFSEQGPISEEQLVAMRRCSPIAHVHRVRAPTALMLGSGDKRVPCYQGLDYARRLKANGVPTRVYMYNDNHSLASLPFELDSLINSILWFTEHLKY